MRSILFLLTLPLLATTTVVRVAPSQTTATVYVITDQVGNCTYKSSEKLDGSFSPLDFDVDPSIFSGSNSDARDGSSIIGTQHVFTIGRRRTDVGSDSIGHSRALQAATMHQGSVTCGGDAAVLFLYTTQNPPLGRSYVEAPPYNSALFGNYGWPNINWTDPTKTYVDPMSGLLIKRVTDPVWQMRSYENASFYASAFLGTNWTNPNNITTWPGVSGTLATYSAATSDPLFVAVDLSTNPDYTGGALTISGWYPAQTPVDVRLRTYGYGDNSTAANRAISVCISPDSGQTCLTSTIDATLQQTTAASGTTAPASGYPAPMFTSWASAPFFHGRGFGTVLTTVTTSGHTITNTGTQSSQYFPCDTWKAGGKVLVNGSEVYTIATNGCVNSTTLTVVETVTTHGANVTFKSLCVGFKIIKKTATGTINIAVGYDVAYGQEFVQPDTGARNQCSPNSQQVSGRTTYLCIVSQANGTEALFAFFPDIGESRLLSIFQSNAGYTYHAPDWSMSDGASPSIQNIGSGSTWDPTIPTRFYTNIQLHGHYSPCQIDYTGTFAAYNPGYFILDPTVGNTNWNQSDFITYTALGYSSANQAVDQLAAAYGNPYYATIAPTNFTFLGIIQGQFAWQIAQSQDQPSFIVFQNLTSPYAITAMYDNLSTYPDRYEGQHSSLVIAGQIGSSFNILGNKGVGPTAIFGGPWLFTANAINIGSGWTSNTSLSAVGVGGSDVCPGTIAAQWQALGATGNNCIQIRYYVPCSANAGTTEITNFPCPTATMTKSSLGDLQPGDRFWIAQDGNVNPCQGSCGSMSAETLRVVTTPIASGNLNERQAYFLRYSEDFGTIGGTYGGSGYAHGNGWVGVMIPPEARTVSWNWYNPSAHFPECWCLAQTHADIGVGLTIGNYSSIMSANPNLPLNGGYGIRYNQTFASQVNTVPTYNLQIGFFNGIDNENIGTESYISMRQINAAQNNLKGFFDLNHLNPSGGVGQENFAGVGTIACGSGPVAGTTGVFKCTTWPGTHTSPKYSPPLAYAGRFIHQDISGPGVTITDANQYAYCVVYVAGECRSGSAVGEVYPSVPNVDLIGITDNLCIAGWYATTSPCPFTASGNQAWAVQVDASQPQYNDNYWRKLTMGFSGPGRQYQFGNIIPTPDGTWAFMQGYWLDGERNEMLAIKLPPLPERNSANPSYFTPVSVQYACTNCYIRAEFGYLENGTAGQYFCETRQEKCVTDTVVTPYAWETSDAPVNPLHCVGRCTLQIPGKSGLVMYYDLEITNSSGGVLSTISQAQVVVP